MADPAPEGALTPTIVGPIPEGSLVLFSGIAPDFDDDPDLPARLAEAVAYAAGHQDFVVYIAPVTAGVAIIDAATALEELRTVLASADPEALARLQSELAQLGDPKDPTP